MFVSEDVEMYHEIAWSFQLNCVLYFCILWWSTWIYGVFEVYVFSVFCEVEHLIVFDEKSFRKNFKISVDYLFKLESPFKILYLVPHFIIFLLQSFHFLH